ncbi:OprO/OprP family phosphate-selective porin [Arenimonas caeni]|jgi:phosphate-selective porin OprO/OprP|uniref:OprO/OprP family phosphate-selective porin n=1 Tax=Arenimonas caeni TaxID=2058085 RepID=UPI002A36836A|nr:porin [Arenimonas caeni]MDY0021148.1 porin [Arenimonas caeni]
MRLTILAASLAAALTGLAPGAAHAQQASDQELAELKAQLATLMNRIDELEARDDAQSAVNIDTAESLKAMQTTQPKVETKGGLKVTSADGAFSFGLGGRLHFDGYAFDRDLASTTGTTEFRRGRLTLSGTAYGWEYKMEQDFAAGSNLDGLRDLYIARTLGPGKLTIGHFKPYRSMEELTSSNEILMMERPYASATGLFSGRQFQQGVGYLMGGANWSAGATAFNLRGASGARNEGMGFSGRATWAPLMQGDRVLHLGGWYSHENKNQGSANLAATANYAGRRGPSLSIASSNGASGEQVDAYGLEFAGMFGPLFFQSEYANASFGQPLGPDQDVETFYVQGSLMLNGGRKVYKPGNGVFGSPKVAGAGLWELTARFDQIENKDLIGREASSWILGMNYYVNPNLRFIFNYTQGDNELTGDETGQYALRTQFNF